MKQVSLWEPCCHMEPVDDTASEVYVDYVDFLALKSAAIEAVLEGLLSPHTHPWTRKDAIRYLNESLEKSAGFSI